MSGSINPAYEAADRARSYDLTQEHIAPKRQLFDQVIEQASRCFSTPMFRILDVGAGPGAFLDSLANRERLAFRYVAVDLSVAMTARIAQRATLILSDVPRAVGRSVFAIGGVNVMDMRRRELLHAFEEAPFHIVVASQFEQYCPNSETSPLARELSDDGVTFVTKSVFRAFVKSLLVPGGLYVTIQDYMADDPESEGRSLDSWDTFVAESLHALAFTITRRTAGDRLFNKIKGSYGPQTTAERRRNSAAQARVRRREFSREEIQTWQMASAELNDLFGAANVDVVPHPEPSLSRFRMVVATNDPLTGKFD